MKRGEVMVTSSPVVLQLQPAASKSTGHPSQRFEMVTALTVGGGKTTKIVPPNYGVDALPDAPERSLVMNLEQNSARRILYFADTYLVHSGRRYDGILFGNYYLGVPSPARGYEYDGPEAKLGSLEEGACYAIGKNNGDIGHIFVYAGRGKALSVLGGMSALALAPPSSLKKWYGGRHIIKVVDYNLL